jgi:predicted DNA-binding antitoxin AbrB/MazE fold protein
VVFTCGIALVEIEKRLRRQRRPIRGMIPTGGNMSRTIEAVFDGEVLRPEGPLELQPNTHVRITIEESTTVKAESHSFLHTARLLNLEGPTNWSERVEEYLYGNQAEL